MRNENFDLIASLGGNCDVAYQLRWRNLRPYALPFDWLLMSDPVKTFRYLTVGFEDRFRDFCLKENLQPWRIDPKIPVDGLAPHLYFDSLTGWIFLHHFNRPVEESGAYGDVYRVLRQRIDRLYAKIAAARRILFVASANDVFDPTPCDTLHAKLNALFPGKDINLRVMQFKAPEETAEPGRWGKDGGLWLHRRPRNRYDFNETNFEWAFLDDLCADGHPLKPCGLDKLRYKIWKHLGRVLRAKGINAGCNHGYDSTLKKR